MNSSMIQSIFDVSSTLMDVMWYRADASSLNPALPSLLLGRSKFCKLEVLLLLVHPIKKKTSNNRLLRIS
jgi:hypothetical protein